MAAARRESDKNVVKRPLPPPAKTLEGREEQLIAAAMDLVEQRIHEGTASAQETVHFLKLGSVKNQLEQDKIRNDNLLLQTRVQEMASRQSGEQLMEVALRAFRGYAGLDDIDPEEQIYDPDL